MAGIAGRVGDAVKVRGMFIAPSQIKMISSKYNSLPLQVVVTRKGHADVLTVRIEKINQKISDGGWEEKFKKLFRELCTVKIDTIEFVEQGMIASDSKLLVDQRQW